MPMIDYCRFCGKELDYQARIDATFCNDTCRADFHNQKKKLRRAHVNALIALEALAAVMTSQSGNASEALKMLESLEQYNLKLRADVVWVCQECGQQTFLRPTPGTICGFCQHDKFSLHLPRKKAIDSR